MNATLTTTGTASRPFPAMTETQVTCETCQGATISGVVQRVTRHQVVFELSSPDTILRFSEALKGLRIMDGRRILYSGEAVVTHLLSAGASLVVEARLGDGWNDLDSSPQRKINFQLTNAFQDFVQKTREASRIAPEFKLVVADLQTGLQDLHRWLDQVEVGFHSHGSEDRSRRELEVLDELREPVFLALRTLFEQFEDCCRTIDAAAQPAHWQYAKRQLHPLVLCSPFLQRSFRKPLGYAGDYEMVSMMLRDPLEGPSLFAKLLNAFFLSSPSVTAQRGRIDYLKPVLVRETARVIRSGREARIFNFGCGPAREVEEFIAEWDLSNVAEFVLADCNDESLEHARRLLSDIISRRSRSSKVRLVRRSVAQLLKEPRGTDPGSRGYDLVYCADLFDFLPDYICEQLIAVFCALLAPGGLLVAMNLDQGSFSRRWMEYAADLHQVNRDCKHLAELTAGLEMSNRGRPAAETRGMNTVLTVRKPSP